MCFELIIECILHGNENQRELAFKILEEFLKEEMVKNNDNNS